MKLMLIISLIALVALWAIRPNIHHSDALAYLQMAALVAFLVSLAGAALDKVRGRG